MKEEIARLVKDIRLLLNTLEDVEFDIGFHSLRKEDVKRNKAINKQIAVELQISSKLEEIIERVEEYDIRDNKGNN